MSFCSSVCERIDRKQFQTSLKNACQVLKSESSAINKPLAQQLHMMFSCGEDVDQLSCKQMCTDLKPMLCSDQFDPMAKYFCDNTVLKEEEKHTVGRACRSLKNIEPFKNMCKSIEKIEHPVGCQQYIQDAKAAYCATETGYTGCAHQA